MAVSQTRIDVIKGVRKKVLDDTTKQYKFGPLIPFSANAAAIYFPKREGQLEDHTLQEKITEIEDNIVEKFTNIIPDETPSTVSATTSSIGTAPAEGTSEKYARQDHQHQILVETGTSSGQIKIGGTDVTVKDWRVFQGSAISSAGSTMGLPGLVPGPTPSQSELYLKGDGTWSLPTTYGTMVGAAGDMAGASGLVPAPIIGDQVKFLRGDGVWAIPTDTTYEVYKGATASAAGTAGLVPAATSGSQELFLRGDATWQTPANTTYGTFTSAANGLVPQPTSDQATTGYVLTGAGWQEGTKYNSDNNTTYSNFTSAAAGLVPMAKSGSTNIATSAYVLTGAGWMAGTKYNTDTNTTYSFSNSNPTLNWNTKSTIGTVGGVALTVTMPGNPNTNTTYGNMRGATASAAGAAGLVPTPAAGRQGYYLRGDGTWQVPTNTTYAFSNKGPTLAWNTVSTIATVGGVNLTVKLPANPNTWPGAATSASLGLIKVNAGTAAANTTNCPANCIYFKY